MQDNEFWRHFWRCFDVISSKVISIAENVFILNKIQMEENVSAFNTIFGIDVNGVQYFESLRNAVSGSYFGFEIYSKSFVLNRSVLIEIFHLLTTFIYQVLTVYY